MTMRRSRSVAAAAAAVVLGSAGVATADVGPIPEATLIPSTTLCMVDGWEYAPRWSTPDNGFVSPSLEDCAMQCEADAVCTGATFIVSGSEKNCWFKDWGTGLVAPPCKPPADSNLVYQAIIDPAGQDCAAIEFMAETVYGCEVESEIEDKPDVMAPAAAEEDAVAPVAAASTTTDPSTLAALNPAYTAYGGVDYGPLQTPAPLVVITDIPDSGAVVADAVECAQACDATPGCNSASYYGDNASADWPGGLNCYLKTLTGCTLPDDAQMTTDATIFMIGGMECANGGAAADAPLAGATAPLAATPLTAPFTSAVAPATFGFDDASVPPLSTDDGVSTDRAFGPTEAGDSAGVEAGAGTGVPPAAATPSGAIGGQHAFTAAASAVVVAALLL